MGARTIHFEVKQFSGARVIGRSVKVNVKTTLDDPTINDLLNKMTKNGEYDYLFGLEGALTTQHDTVGWQGNYNFGDEVYTYIAGVLFKPDTVVPSDFEYRDIATCNMAVVWIEETDDENGDVFADASSNLGKARSENGYQYDGSHGLFEMEYYSEERFYKRKNEGRKIILDFYSPCKKA